MAPLPNFRIETVESRSGTTIKLGGELDSATSTALLARFERAVAEPAAGEIVIDLQDVSFIDSAGIRAIVMIQQSAEEHAVGLAVVPAPEQVTELLQIAGLADQLTLAPLAGEVPPAARFIERVDLDLAREPTAPGRARSELRQAARGRLSDGESATATLLTSELVTNAVIHAQGATGETVGLRIILYADRLRVEVTDSGSGFDLDSLPSRPRQHGGHGLLVVEGLASRWGTSHGVVAGEPLFCVWFELDTELEQQETLAPAEESSTAGAEG